MLTRLPVARDAPQACRSCPAPTQHTSSHSLTVSGWPSRWPYPPPPSSSRRPDLRLVAVGRDEILVEHPQAAAGQRLVNRPDRALDRRPGKRSTAVPDSPSGAWNGVTNVHLTVNAPDSRSGPSR